MPPPISLDQSSLRKPPSISQQEFPPEILEHLLIVLRARRSFTSESSFDTPEEQEVRRGQLGITRWVGNMQLILDEKLFRHF
jgi:hypothetical protein